MDYDRFIKKFRILMKECGMNNTPQREYVIKALFSTDKHLDIDEIAQIIKDKYKSSISRASLYRTLTFLEEVHVVHALTIDSKSSKVYELSLREHHDHIICTKCGSITEFYDEMIEKQQKEIMLEHNFILENHNMMLYGICEMCQEKEG